VKIKDRIQLFGGTSARVSLLRSLVLGSIAFASLHGLALAEEPLKPGEPMDYTKLAFQPDAWKKRQLDLNLIPWTGKHVVFLTVGSDFDPELMGKWVSRLDRGWEVYAELTGRKPRPYKQVDGKVSIGAVPGPDLTCGAGCGYVGATGIELAMFYDHNYPQLQSHPNAMPHYVFYEMGRNFYTFGDRHSCFTTGFAVFMRYVCMDALNCEDTDLETRKVIERVEPLLSESGLDFIDLFTTSGGTGEKVNRIKDRDGKVLSPSDQPVRYATAMMRLRRENGGDDWVRKFFRELAKCPEVSPQTKEGALQQGWYWMLAASIAAQKDLSAIFAGEWKLPITDRTRKALAAVDWKKDDLSIEDFTSITPE
jgi:hypothetical protein